MNTDYSGTLLVTGGCRSGKSGYAQRWAEAQSGPRIFLATAEALDTEMSRRIGRHKARRGPEWCTVEEPLEVLEALNGLMATTPRPGVVLLDCVTLWISNLMGRRVPDKSILNRVSGLAAVMPNLPCNLAVVTNEVGWGLVPGDPVSRRFRDLAGEANQILAAAADEVVCMVSGLAMRVKG